MGITQKIKDTENKEPSRPKPVQSQKNNVVDFEQVLAGWGSMIVAEKLISIVRSFFFISDILFYFGHPIFCGSLWHITTISGGCFKFRQCSQKSFGSVKLSNHPNFTQDLILITKRLYTVTELLTIVLSRYKHVLTLLFVILNRFLHYCVTIIVAVISSSAKALCLSFYIFIMAVFH